ncbi:MAG TPA: type II secretion system F family protein [Moraxellaceae bacterium]|nr:type II secretion system F family protein [Moraxellaceae bacterium]
MSIYTLSFFFLIFVAVTGLAWLALQLVVQTPLEQRLKRLSAESASEEFASEAQWHERVLAVAGPIGKLALPKGGWERSHLRTRFMNAGLRNASAPAVYFAAKTVLTFALPALFLALLGLSRGYVSSLQMLFGIVLFASMGYYLPTVVLSHLISRRQRELFENFPDALDLMIVCIEAGLSLDATIDRTADEMRINSPALADELHLVTLELRAGASREQALRNLALRSGVEEIDALVAMLIQADRFGTSIADSLRVQADSLRTKRRIRAEIAAAKIPTKMLFPLIFCIFPSLLVVLLGPAVISIHRILLPVFRQSGGG